MSGLDKILESIQSEADASAADILDGAAKEAAQIRQEAEAEAARECSLIEKNAAERVKDISSRSRSASDLKVRQQKLALKQELIAGVIRAALAKAKELPEEEYFAMLLKMASSAAHTGEGTLILGEGDLARLPKDFSQKLDASLPEGAVLTVSGEPGKIDSGFILSYDGVEENCTFEAVLLSRNEEVQDRIRQIIF